MPRRFPPPWSIEERQESFIVKDADGQRLAYLPKLPGVPRQILKDIQRPPKFGQPRRLKASVNGSGSSARHALSGAGMAASGFRRPLLHSAQ